MNEVDRTGLLPEDHSPIAIVDDRRREVWFRKARYEYLCPRPSCHGRWHRTWSAVGERHDPKRNTPPTDT